MNVSEALDADLHRIEEDADPWAGKPGLFGVPLAVAAARSDLTNGLTPSVITKGCLYLRENALLGTEGLTRKPGSRVNRDRLIEGFNQEYSFDFPPGTPAADVCSVMLQFSKELVDNNGDKAFFWGTVEDRARYMNVRRSVPEEEWGSALREIVESLPACNQATLEAHCGLLHEASDPLWSATNRMHPKLFARTEFVHGTDYQNAWAYEQMIRLWPQVFGQA